MYRRETAPRKTKAQSDPVPILGVYFNMSTTEQAQKLEQKAREQEFEAIYALRELLQAVSKASSLDDEAVFAARVRGYDALGTLKCYYDAIANAKRGE